LTYYSNKGFSQFNITFKVWNNADFTHSFQWVRADGQPVLMTNSTLKMQIKKKASDVNAVSELTSANSKAVIDPVNANIFTIEISKGTLQSTYSMSSGVEVDTPYVFDLIEIKFDGKWNMIASGTISVRKGVTQ
jgi:hypothetical protein